MCIRDRCFALTGVLTIVWVVIGYSLAFDTTGSMNTFVGGFSKVFASGIGVDTLSGTIPESVFLMFQMTIAIITPALMVGAFAPNKRVDLAVRAFNQLKLPLKIVGSGQDEEYCRSIAGDSIEFLGALSSEKLLELYQQARALVFPGEDDFGITPLEAQSCNTPVIAFASGGAMETVTEQTGLFFAEQKVDALCEAVEKMEQTWKNYVSEEFRKQTSRFGREQFKKQMARSLLSATRIQT